ncbi:hypothetical protein [Fictibacillus sp. KU28468]|uniref:hypothetical protein n=1 Tax=Fictibacillus sp. KU28468 TaxID=2991053 RepID=UPI00223C8E51|nr:hypothetical protein [Fictibacillus sp. KU28468]UZJ78260.1 hypothetical protein OKX00_19250 [Fictibacillus sp. KU28468]
MILSKNKNLFLFFSLSILIILCHFSLYRLEFMAPLPKNIGLATLFDFLIVIPLLSYVFIIRKRYSLKYVPLVVIAACWLAKMIVPAQKLPHTNGFPFLLFSIEGILIIYELYILFYTAITLMKAISAVRGGEPISAYFNNRMRQTLSLHMTMTRAMECILTEMTVLYYAFFSWKKKERRLRGQIFTYHKKTAAIAFRFMLIHALLIESIGFHYLLMQWSGLAAWAFLLLNVYTILFFLGDIQAIRSCPFVLNEKELVLQPGLAKSLTIAVSNIQSIERYTGHEPLTKVEEKRTFDAVLLEFSKEKPAFEIKLIKPETVRMAFGFTKQVDTVHLSVDDGQIFFEVLRGLVENQNESS